MAKKLTYTVVLEPQGEGGFTVVVPALPEVVTEGEALRMAERYPPRSRLPQGHGLSQGTSVPR
jgi:hypothetical protein